MDDILFYELAGIGGYMATKRSSTSSSVAAKDVGERAKGHLVALSEACSLAIPGLNAYKGL